MQNVLFFMGQNGVVSVDRSEVGDFAWVLRVTFKLEPYLVGAFGEVASEVQVHRSRTELDTWLVKFFVDHVKDLRFHFLNVEHLFCFLD